MNLYSIDIRILWELQNDGSLTNAELAKRIHLTPSPCLALFEQRIAEHDEVMECYLMTGESDYLIRVAVTDIGALEKFILEQLTPIPGIEKIRSSFALKQVRYNTALPLPAR